MFINLQDRNLTQVLNNSVSLKNIDISPKSSNSFSTNKSKEFSSPIKSASEPAVAQSLNNKTNHTKVSTPTGSTLIIENSTPDPVRKTLFLLLLLFYIVLLSTTIYV